MKNIKKLKKIKLPRKRKKLCIKERGRDDYQTKKLFFNLSRKLLDNHNDETGYPTIKYNSKKHFLKSLPSKQKY